MSNENKRTTWIPAELHRQAKMEAARLGIEIEEIVADGLKEKLAKLKKLKGPVAA